MEYTTLDVIEKMTKEERMTIARSIWNINNKAHVQIHSDMREVEIFTIEKAIYMHKETAKQHMRYAERLERKLAEVKLSK